MGDEEAEVVLPKVKKCLIVMTSAETLSDESPTGYYLSEVVHPYNTFIAHGWEVAFASIAGTAVADPASVEAADPETAAFWDDSAKKALLDAPTKLADIPIETATAEYEALYFAGGFGCMVDFAECAEAQALIKAFVEGEGKIVAAVCHGPIVFANIEAGEGKLLADKKVTAFTDVEEEAMGKLELMTSGPGTCQTKLSAAGAKFQVGLKFEPQVVMDGNIFTGQNPASATPLATAVVYAFDPIKKEFEQPRLKMLKERELLVAAIEGAEKEFAAALDGLKKQEASGAAVADKLDELQYKTVAGREFRAAKLIDIDRQIERIAMKRKMAIDAKIAAEKAAAEE